MRGGALVDCIAAQLRALLEAAAAGPLPADSRERAALLFGELMLLTFSDRAQETRVHGFITDAEITRGLRSLGEELASASAQ